VSLTRVRERSYWIISSCWLEFATVPLWVSELESPESDRLGYVAQARVQKDFTPRGCWLECFIITLALCGLKFQLFQAFSTPPVSNLTVIWTTSSASFLTRVGYFGPLLGVDYFVVLLIIFGDLQQ
jgi:hypothetical protein